MIKDQFTVCIVGGGSRYTPGILKMLVAEKERFPLAKVILFDNEAERQEKVGAYGRILMKEYYPECEVIDTTDPDVAFTDIDFAFMQIRAGRMMMRRSDEHIALKHGCIGQETCGAGGFAYGMRSIPAVCDLIRQIRERSPEAWVLNYSNPAAIVAEATKRVFPGDKRIINICDMPVGIMNQYADELGVPRNQIEPRYFGLNHFGWFTAVLDKDTGEDYLPRLREIFSQDLPEDAFSDIDASWSETFHFMRKMVRECPEGMLPNTYLQYYLYRDHMLSIEDPEHTRADQVLEGHEKQTFEMIEEVVAAGKLEGTKYAFTLEDLKDDDHATYIADLAYALSHNTHDIFLCMTENTGIVSNLTEGMMVEVPCMVGTNGVEPLNVGEIPTFQKGLLENQYAYEKLTADAALEGSYRKALDALTLNRLVGDTDLARALLDDYIEANKGYWPELS
ncbi:MAG: 6-phospho-alpha-glucosidase [Collinsella sp.]|nr:6-phospho-alpha-glucosidase [Collinsella sp.]